MTSINRLDPNLPCIVGTARRTWHSGGSQAPEPLDMWEELSRSALVDVGGPKSRLADIDHVGLVHCQSWAYDRPADRLAARLGLEPGGRQESLLAGTAPQRLINAAARKMLSGQISVALIVGGEALATAKSFRAAGEPLPWSHQHPDPPPFPVDLDEWYLPTEIAHGVLPAWLTFALLEQARWAERGATSVDRQTLGENLERLAAVAAGTPGAWFREGSTARDLTTCGPANRMIASPYTKRMTAFMDVDMAAANLMVTRATADRWGVPDERRVYLRGWGFARDETHIAARAELGASGGMRAATSTALQAAGFTVEDIDVFDLYSCFGSAVAFAQDALGLDPGDPRPITLTGGLPYYGGPSSNYTSHSISHTVDHLRSHPGHIALTTGVGMHMTKHVAAVWATRPGSLRNAHDDGAQRFAVPEPPGARTVLAHHTGTGRIVATTVAHSADGSADRVVAICETDTGDRCYAASQDPDIIAGISEDAWPGLDAEIEATAAGVNELRLPAA